MCCVVSPCDMLSYVECVLYRIVSQYVVLHLLVVFLSLYDMYVYIYVYTYVCTLSWFACLYCIII